MGAINNTITVVNQTVVVRVIATGMVNGFAAAASRLKRKWHSLHAWISSQLESSRLLSELESYRLTRQPVLVCAGYARSMADAPDVRPQWDFAWPGRADLRGSRLRSLSHS